MKKLKLTILVILLSASTVWAQGAMERKDKSCDHKHKSSKDYPDKKCDKSKSQYGSWIGELNLTEEQKKMENELSTVKKSKMEATKQKYSPIMDKMKAEMNEAKKKSETERVSEEVKSQIKGKYHSQLEPMRKEMESIRNEYKNSLSAILTPDQKEKMKEIKKDLPQKGKDYHKRN